MQKPLIIGIAGGSASGKTSIAAFIKSTFADKKCVLIIRQDDYYIKISLNFLWRRD